MSALNIHTHKWLNKNNVFIPPPKNATFDEAKLYYESIYNSKPDGDLPQYICVNESMNNPILATMISALMKEASKRKKEDLI